MHGTLSAAEIAAIKPSAENCRRRQDSAEPLWFAILCRELWGANAPKELEFRTGRSDRTCRAWALGDNLPPLEIVLNLLRDNECGQYVLGYAMRDCDAPWWTARERQRLDSELLRKFVDEITQRE